MRRKLLHLILGSVLGVGICETESPVFAEVLVPDGEIVLNAKYHTPLTKDALLAALHDPDYAVRTNAALKLAFRGERDTIPSIMAALENERVPGARVSLAWAAAQLGATQAVEVLKDMCRDWRSPPFLRLDAATVLIYMDKEDCLGDIVNVLRSNDDEEIQEVHSALCILAGLRHIPAVELMKIRYLAPVFLKSDNQAIRASVADLLAKFGDSSSVEYLRTALAAEKDDSVQMAIAAALKSLETRRSTGQPE